MKKMVNRYRISKFHRFMNGLVFGIISVIALLLCLSSITVYQSSDANVILWFLISICSMLLGLFSMFRTKEGQKAGV
jgi:hypothetical protein